jgi:hypothetical protein
MPRSRTSTEEQPCTLNFGNCPEFIPTPTTPDGKATKPHHACSPDVDRDSFRIGCASGQSGANWGRPAANQGGAGTHRRTAEDERCINRSITALIGRRRSDTPGLVGCECDLAG